MHESLQQFHPVIRKWFEEKVGLPTPPQTLGWPVISAGKSCLILAPTGSGKTLAAFLAAIDWLVRRLLAVAEQEKTLWGVQILYVSPLKSLANDIQKNLLRPLKELEETAVAMKEPWPEIHVAVRTGDTPQRERAAISRRPPHILITTPESLNLMLTSGGRNALATARFLIVDEVHALAGNKRGVFLSLLLERLEEERRLFSESPTGRLKIAPGVFVLAEPVSPLVRIGLSATARPEERIAAWLAGYDDDGNPRPIDIVRSGQRKRLDLAVVCPFGGAEEELLTPEERKERPVGHWPEVTRALLQMIRDHRSTLVFANSRRLIERLAGRFIEELEQEAAYHKKHPEQPAPKLPVILPHHGSISKEVRLETEQALKRGEVDAVLATSSLELGIDVGTLDLVIQVDSPGNIAGALQRVGRAGHLEKATAKGRLLARGIPELSSLAALVPLMYAGTVEETHIPENCLDVLAQQLVAACAVRPWKRPRLFHLARRATPFHALSEKQFDSVVAMLSKRAERVTSQGLRPRLSFDRVNDELLIMPGASKVVMVNSGVISDTGQFPVYLLNAKRKHVTTADVPPNNTRDLAPGTKDLPGLRLGELDEEFVYETKEGDRIILGSQTWRVARIDADRVLVESAEPGSSRMPFWRGEQAPRSELLADAVAAFHGEMEQHLVNESDDATRAWLTRVHHFDEQAADNAVAYYRRQMSAGVVPTASRLVIEHFHDRTGEPLIAILAPLGSRANYALRLALEGHFARRRLPAQLVHNDDGILIRPPVEVGEIPDNPLAWLRAAAVEHEITDQLETTALFGLRFRQNAARALMLPRMTVTQRTPLWQQRLRARHLLALVKKQRNFPIIVETYRECLQDVLAIPRIQKLLRYIEAGCIAVHVARNAEPSPFARSIHSQFQASYLYEWDDPLTQNEVEPTIDQSVLDEILQRRQSTSPGQPPEAIVWTPADEETLHRRILGSDYPARTPEELLEKIEAAGAVGLSFGDATDPQWQSWVAGAANDVHRMLTDLAIRRRILLVDWDARRSKNHARWFATENLAILLAAIPQRPLLINPATGEELPTTDLPPALLETTLTPSEAQRLIVEQLLRRAPTITESALLAELPWMKKEARAILNELLRAGIVQKIAPTDPTAEPRLAWTEYLEQLRTIALRRQRKAAATADVASLQRHLLRWHHVDSPRQGVDAAEDVLDMLTGISAPLSVWELEILPTRIADFTPALLDGICRNGHRVWVGGAGGTSESGGGADNAIAFWPRHLLAERPAHPTDAPLSTTAQKLLDFLQKNGASFLLDLQLGLSLDDGELALVLKELVSRGLVSNDQLESLREIERVAANVRRTKRPSDGRREAWKARYAGKLLSDRRPSRMASGWWKSRDASGGAGLGGRWFLLPPPRSAATANTTTAIDLAERAADRVERLLRRTAFACRELIDPHLDGPWRDCYDVLTRMEWAGTVRRGYFVEGITGSQFALPAARLEPLADSPIRPVADSPVTWLSMLDPANLWAQISTRWMSDAGEPARIPRTAGSWIALIDGRPVLAAVSWGQRLIPLPASWELQERALSTVATLHGRLPRLEKPYLEIKFWDQRDIIGSPAEAILRQQGFSRDTQGLRLYRQYFPQNAPAAATPSRQP